VHPVSRTAGAQEERSDDAANSGTWILLRDTALEHFRSQFAPTHAEAARWASLFAKYAGLTQGALQTMAETEKEVLRRLKAEYSAARSDTQSPTRPGDTLAIPSRYRALYPDLRSVQDRLKELDTKHLALAFWEREAVLMGTMKNVVSSIYGGDRVHATKEEIERQKAVREQAGFHSLPDEVIAHAIENNKANRLFREYIVHEIREGENILFENRVTKSRVLDELSSAGH